MYKIPANTLFIGQSLVFMPECHSTNIEVAKLVQQKDVIEGTVVITNNQTAGRGQRGNTWIAEPEQNLTFSILLKPTFVHVKDQFLLSKAIALGVHAYCQSHVTHEVKIKWPNDILIKDRKVCGILIENHVNKTILNYSIAGIGLNVNQQEFNIPTAASIRNFTNEVYNLSEQLNDLLSQIESYYLLLRQGKLEDIDRAYSNALYWVNESHMFNSSKGEFEGIIKGVNDSGRLVIETAEGERTFDVKEVTYIR